ncbi:MAG: hypothetical protein OXG37_13960 [Actinomycetia bacterium]|nr:hypothetical protein [Actinomycetes bacterium]
MHLSMNVTSEPPERRATDIEGEFWQHLSGSWLQLRKLPSPAKDGKPIRQLFDIPAQDFEISEIWAGQARSSSASPGSSTTCTHSPRLRYSARGS